MKKIGIVIHANAMLFSNGITQNAYFLYQCLHHCGYTCEFLCNEPNPPPFHHEKIPLTQILCDNPLVFNPDDYSLIINVTRSITKQQYNMFHSKNIRVIGVVCGNHYMQDQEDFVYGSTKVTFEGKSETNDELWVIPSYYRYKTYMEILRKIPVYQLPHLWHPCILKKRALDLSKINDERFMYDISKHTASKIDIIIMEPNLSYLKNAWLPLIASEGLHLKQPDLINNVFVFNFPEKPNNYSMIHSLSLGSKIRPFKRLEMDQILAHFSEQNTIPIFLTHHNNNHLNFLYYELLYYGYPLIHNSDMLDGCGYFYDDLDTCIHAVINAYTHHNKNISKYKADGLQYLERVNPFNSNVCMQMKELVSSVCVGK